MSDIETRKFGSHLDLLEIIQEKEENMVAIEENRSESEGKDGQTIIQPHPFLMDHIIEKVLGYLCQDNLSELFNARLVCRQWNYYSTRILRRKFYLSFGGHKYNIGRLKTFLDEFETNFTPSKSSQSGTDNSISFPVVRFRLFSDLFQECNKSTVMDFMTKCGPFTEALVIYKDINSDIEYTLEELSLLHFPRLKELAFSDRRRSHFSLDANQQTFLYHLILSAKEVLTSLAIKYPREPIYEIYEKEELLVKILTQCKMPKLRHLKLDMSVTDKVLRALSDLNLRLQGLQLCLGASTFSSDSLKKVLTSVRTTLEELRLTDLYRRAALTVDMPRMDLVHTFEIHGIELPAYFVAFPNFSYESKLPNLKKLQLNTWAPTKDWEVLVPELVKSDNDDKNNNNNSILQKKVYQKNQQSILTIAKISELSLAMNFTCPALMLRVASLFSGVKTLELHFSRGSVQALQTVFKHMGQLEELKLNQSYLGELATNCIDDVLTGMDAEQCRWILKKKAFLGIDLGRMEKQPCISDLKNLKKLDMMGLRYRNIITDVSGYLVFLEMDSLTTLDIGRSELSDHCLRDLAERFPNGKFQRYLNKKRMKSYDTGLYKNSVFTSICSLQ